MNKRLIVIISVLVIAASYILYEVVSLNSRLNSFQIRGDSKSILIKSLPSITFNDFNSKQDVSTDYFKNKGNRIIVHFWATWCAPCENEFPDLLNFAFEKKNVTFLLISVNDKPKDIEKFIKKYQAKSKNVYILTDNNNFFQKYFGTYRLPESLLFDQSGSSIKKFVGAQDWNSPNISIYFP